MKKKDKYKIYDEIIKPIEKKYQILDALSLLIPLGFVTKKKEKYNKLLKKLYILLLK